MRKIKLKVLSDNPYCGLQEGHFTGFLLMIQVSINQKKCEIKDGAVFMTMALILADKAPKVSIISHWKESTLEGLS